jgi:putative ABC transport system permease protein
VVLHYFASALAKFRKAPFTTAANVATLALGLACFISAYGIATFWRSGDAYQPHAERIFYIAQASFGKEAAIASSAALPTMLREEIPELEAVAQIQGSERNAAQELPIKTDNGGEAFLQSAGADHALLDIFSFDFVEGDPKTALRTSSDVVLTEPVARKLFGASPALGHTLSMGSLIKFTVTGVIASVRQPSFMGQGAQSPMSFDMLQGRDPVQPAAPFVWNQVSGATIVKLPPSLAPKAFQARLEAMAARASSRAGFDVKFVARPIADLTTRIVNQRFLSQENAGLSVSAILLWLGALIFVVACVNYANLAAAQAEARLKEIGMRKVLGAGRRDLLAQHMVEAALLVLPALGLALLTVALAAPVFRNILDVEVTHFLANGPRAALVLVAAAIASAAAAAVYPAFAAARARAADALGPGAVRTGSGALARLLVGVQFLSTSFLVIIVTVAQLQHAHLREMATKPGHDPVVILGGVPGVKSFAQLNGPRAADFETLSTELRKAPQVRSVTATSALPWIGGGWFMTFSRSGDAGALALTAETKSLTRDFVETYGVKVLAGRALDPDRDRSSAAPGQKPTPGLVPAMIDLRLAKALGYDDPAQAIGKTLYMPAYTPAASTGGDPLPGTPVDIIVGVVETDASRLIAGTEGKGAVGRVSGVVYTLEQTMTGGWSPAIRVDRNDIPGARAAIERAWRKMQPDAPVRMLFTDEMFEMAYAPFQKIAGAFVVLSICALIISTTGLLGIAVHVAARRRREMGIRKTLGATVVSLAQLLLVDFAKPVLAANLLAWPLGYLAAQAFLAPFAERVALTPAPFLFSLALTLAVASAAVIGEAWKAASVRPAEVLRQA